MESSAGPIYYCYRCNANVIPIALDGGGEVACPRCSEGFLEEVENLAPEAVPANPAVATFERPDRGTAAAAQAFSHMMGALSGFLQHIQTAQSQQNSDGQPSQTTRRPGIHSDVIRPVVVLQGQAQNFIGGNNFQIFFDSGTGDGPQRLPGNIGDYFFGPGLDQLIQQLSENDPNRNGAPPAAKSAIEAMPLIIITEEHLRTDAALCAVCKDAFELEMEVRQMPCSHLYHSECILPWLEHHNSCPLCRYEMPTDDPEYDRARVQGEIPPMTGRVGGFTFFGMPGQLNVAQRPSAPDATSQTASSPGATGEQSSQNPQAAGASPSQGGQATLNRRFSITFPRFRTATAVPQPATNDQNAQANNSETVSTSPANDILGEASRLAGAEDDMDRPVREAYHEDLD